MQPLKILILNHNIEWRGTFQRCYDFAKLLVQRNHQVTIVTNSPCARFRFDEYTFDHITVIRSPDLFWGILRSGWDPVNVLRRYFYFKNQKFDIIHAFDNRPTVILPALWLQNKWRCPLISDWCDWWGRGGAITLRKNKILNFLFSPVETYFEEHYRRHADFLTVISNPLKERAIQLGFPKDKIVVIPPLANVDKIFPVDKKKAKAQLHLDGYSHVLIFSGFVMYDIDLALRAFRMVHARYPKCVLVLTGGVPKEATRPFSDLPILNVGFLSQDQLNDYLGASDLCLLPLTNCLTNRARFPHKIGHYLAAGRPVVSNPVGDAGSLIREHQVGVLTEDNPAAFAEGICGLLNDPVQLEKFGKQARIVAEQHLSGSQYADCLERIYMELLLEKNSKKD